MFLSVLTFSEFIILTTWFISPTKQLEKKRNTDVEHIVYINTGN